MADEITLGELLTENIDHLSSDNLSGLQMFCLIVILIPFIIALAIIIVCTAIFLIRSLIETICSYCKLAWNNLLYDQITADVSNGKEIEFNKSNIKKYLPDLKECSAQILQLLDNDKELLKDLIMGNIFIKMEWKKVLKKRRSEHPQDKKVNMIDFTDADEKIFLRHFIEKAKINPILQPGVPAEQYSDGITAQGLKYLKEIVFAYCVQHHSTEVSNIVTIFINSQITKSGSYITTEVNDNLKEYSKIIKKLKEKSNEPVDSKVEVDNVSSTFLSPQYHYMSNLLYLV